VSTATPPRLAVVVLAWEGREDVLACLASLRPQLGPGDMAVVVDNGSSDGTVDAVRRGHPWAEILENGTNLGYAAGNNVGVKWALDHGYPWIWVLNQDAYLEPGAVETLLAAGAARPDAGALQPLLLDRADAEKIDSLGLRPLRSLGGEDVGRGRRATEAPAATTEIFGASGAAALVRAATIRESGLLDGEMFLLGEDFDWMFRIRMTGAAVLLVPAARVLHRRGVSGKPADPAAARRRKHWLQRAVVALALRYWPAGRLFARSPFLAARAVQAMWTSDADPARPCLPLWRRFLAARGASRRAMAERGLDRWFA
jgi:GT2 family glycosyltransferase